MKIISVRLKTPIQLETRDLPQNQWWSDSPELDGDMRRRAAQVTIEPPFVVIRRGNIERLIPLAEVAWIERAPEQPIEGPKPYVASKEPLTEEEEAALSSGQPAAKRGGWPKGKPRGAKAEAGNG